ncbi:KANSL3 [Bugula neritina]|uniref:KANSL3 n=1 Tax=Bugula neritina TaxID=10212 RepID=A0A7J7J6M6_BUGNE|nr:KANSL3 [Bugula neritina]
MVGAVRNTIAENKELYPNKPIILMGWNFGALLSIYIGSMEKISAVVAMGYPIMGVNGLRGDADDVIMDSITPTLFVIGEHAQTCPIADLENMREKMRAKNHLVVVAGANDHLNVNFKTKKEHSLTQSVVDRCILDEIRSYLEKILTTPNNILMPKLSLTAPMEKIKKKKVKIQTLNGSKIMISGKSDGGLTSLPKKKKSPLKAAKAKKQAKLMQAAFSPAIISEREQLAAIAAITPCTTTNDPLNMSNSSQGSLTALQPQNISIPQLTSSSDAGPNIANSAIRSSNKQEPTEVKSQNSKPQAAQAGTKKDLLPKPATPAYVQLCGTQTGQSFAISIEKAKELMNMGLLRSVERPGQVDRESNFDTTKQLLALPPGTTIGFATPTIGASANKGPAAKHPNEHGTKVSAIY